MTTRSEYISSHRALFWSVGDDNLSGISDVLLVEAILNYGTLEDVRALIELLGLVKVALVVRKTFHNRTRHNYFPEVANFFNLYFNRHAPGNPV